MGEAAGQEHLLLRRPYHDGPAEGHLLPDTLPHPRHLRPLLRLRVSSPGTPRDGHGDGPVCPGPREREGSLARRSLAGSVAVPVQICFLTLSRLTLEVEGNGPCQSPAGGVPLALLPRGSPSVWDLPVPCPECSWLQDSRSARVLLLQPWGTACVLTHRGTCSPRISPTREATPAGGLIRSELGGPASLTYPQPQAALQPEPCWYLGGIRPPLTSPWHPKDLQPKLLILMKKRDLPPPLSSAWEVGWGVGLALH